MADQPGDGNADRVGGGNQNQSSSTSSSGNPEDRTAIRNLESDIGQLKDTITRQSKDMSILMEMVKELAKGKPGPQKERLSTQGEHVFEDELSPEVGVLNDVLRSQVVREEEFQRKMRELKKYEQELMRRAELQKKQEEELRAQMQPTFTTVSNPGNRNENNNANVPDLSKARKKKRVSAKEPTIFDPSKDSINMWLKKYELISKINGWEEEDKLDYVSSYLSEQCISWWLKVADGIRKWSDAKELLLKQFTNMQQKFLLKQEFEDCRQLDNENVTSFSSRLQLAALAYDENTTEEDIKKRFMLGVSDAMSKYLFEHRTLPWTSFVREAQDFENFQAEKNFSQGKKGKKITLPVTPNLPSESEKSTEKTKQTHNQTPAKKSVPNTTSAPENSGNNDSAKGTPSGKKKGEWTADGKPICSRCREPGHLAIGCRNSRITSTPGPSANPETPTKQLFPEPTPLKPANKGKSSFAAVVPGKNVILTVPIGIFGKETGAMVDTGSSISLMSTEAFREAKESQYLVVKEKTDGFQNVSKMPHPTKALIRVDVSIGKGLFPTEFYIAENIAYPIVLGNEATYQKGISVNGKKKKLVLPDDGEIDIIEEIVGKQVAHVLKLSDSISVPARSIAKLPVDAEMEIGRQFLFEPRFKSNELGLVPMVMDAHNKHILIENSTNVIQTLPQGTEIGTMEDLEWCGKADVMETIGQTNAVLNVTRPTAEEDEMGSPPIYSLEEAEKLEMPSGLDLGQPDITEDERKKLIVKLKQNRDCFVEPDGMLGQCSLAEHTIETGATKPLNLKSYRLSVKELEVMEKEIKMMLEKGVIQPSQSPWCSPVVMAKKKDGGICIDFRAINKYTEKDVYPVPNIENMLARLQKARIFSLGDAWSGFWQILLRKADRIKTAFRTPYGLFEFVVMPFGLKNATATFQRAMDRMLQGILFLFIMVYVDDLLVYSQNFAEHMEHLQIFFNRLRKANLKLKGAKCRFCLKRVDYLGFTVGEGEILPNRKKVEAIYQYPTPQNVTDIKRFTGMTQFYRRFVKDYATITGPLTMLTRKDTPWNWTKTHDRLFWTLKKALMDAPVLRLPDLSKPFILYTDASGFAVGAILAQKDEEGKEYVVYYASRTLNAAESRYATIEKECLAVVWAGVCSDHTYTDRISRW